MNTLISANPRFQRRDVDEWQIRAIPLFPNRYRGLLRYADTYTLNSTSGAVATQVISANGLYDPDISGSGHQPVGFDQMMVSYEHYCVTGARIRANFHNNTASVYPTCSIGLSASATPVTTINQIVEDGMCALTFLHPLGVYGSMRTVEQAINIAQFGGLRSILDNSDYRGSVAANPAEQSYFHLQTWDTENATSSCAVDVVVEYEAWFTEPRKLTQSLTAPLTRALCSEEKKKC